MPLNADAEYFIAKEKYEKAKTISEKIAALEQVISSAPTHKGAEKLRAQLKKKLAELKQQQIVAAKKKGGSSSLYSIKKSGEAQAVLIGFAGSGKSSILSAITNARPEISQTPFTTKVPQIGSMKFANMDFQIIEIPAIVPGFSSSKRAGEVFGLLRSADCIFIVVDSRKASEEFSGVMSELRNSGVSLRNITVIANKNDLGRLSLENCQFPVLRTDARKGDGLGQIGEIIWKSLGKIRVYTRKGENTDARPMVMQKDSTVRDAVKMVHKDLLGTFRFARVWRKNSPHSGSRVGMDFSLRDEDTVEIFG